MGHFEENRARAEAFAGKGYDLCKYGRYADALDLFRQATELDPTNYKYWYNAAVACDRIGDHIGMERASQKTIECDGTFVKGYVRLAKALVRQAKYDGAAEIVATGLLIDENYTELQELKKVVAQKQDEISIVEARKLADRLRYQKEQEKIAMMQNNGIGPTATTTTTTTDNNNVRTSQSSSSSAASAAAASTSVTTVMGGNNTHPTTSTKRTGGIPAHQREIPKLNNPHFADSGALRSPPPPQRRSANAVSSSTTSSSSSQQPQQQRELPRLNNPHFGDSSNTSHPHHHHPPVPRLGQPYSRPLVPPNRDNGPDFKDQCGTFIVAPLAVQEMAEGTTTEQAVPGRTMNNYNHNTTNKGRPAAAAAAAQNNNNNNKTAPRPQRLPLNGRGGGYFGMGGRRNTTTTNNNNNNNYQEDNGGGRGMEF